MSKVYTIYLRTNLVNGMRYIGQTSDFRQRENEWKCLKKTYANKYITKDREKYGLENFTVEVIAETKNKEDALDLEERFIKDYNSIYPNGYNLSKRGSVHNHSEETKQKQSEIMKGKYSGENNPMFGKHHSEEAKQKMSEAKKGIKNHMFGKRVEKNLRPCNLYTKDGNFIKRFDCVADAANEIGCAASNITACCRKRIKSIKGFIIDYA